MEPLNLVRDFFDVFECYEQQRRFISGSTRRNQLFLGGVGTGKSLSLSRAGLWLALANPGVPGAILGRTGRDIMDVLMPYWDEAVDMLSEATGQQVVTEFSKGQMRATLFNGASVIFRGYDRIKKLRGLTLGWACIDEIEHGESDPKIVFDIVSSRIRHPAARVPQVKIATTPDGLRGATAWFLNQQRAKSPNVYVVRSTVFDNPYVDDAFRDGLREACSNRRWKQEGLGEVLKPLAVVLHEYNEDIHVIPFKRSPTSRRDWVMSVDWGTSHAYVCAIEPQEDGRWIVFDEHKAEDVSRTKFRADIMALVQRVGCAPSFISADRAIPQENNWLRGVFQKAWVRPCQTKDQQSVIRGVEMIRYMLDPIDREPLLYFAESLPSSLRRAGRGIRGSMVNYRYRRRKDGTISNQPLKDDLNDHAIDALRMVVVMSSDDPQYHGGHVLPYLTPQQYREPGYKKR